jgi:RecJ-like exonuclease
MLWEEEKIRTYQGWNLSIETFQQKQGEQEMANCRVCGVELTEDEEFDGICEECAFDEETEEFLEDWI